MNMSNSKRAEINMSRAQNPYAFLMLQLNLNFTKKNTNIYHGQFNTHMLISIL